MPDTAPLPGSSAANLPVALTSFIGRQREIAQIKALLVSRRLLTLTGSGGVGKTRLALAVATDLQPTYPDGVHWTELAALTDPALVPRTVASVLGIREGPEQSSLAALLATLGTRRLLLVLDNCEHLVEACAELTDAVLRRCPGVQILATSREPLRMAGETPFRVPSLSLPDIDDPEGTPPAQTESMTLFVERAAMILPGFALTARNASAIAQICCRLDGVPLAIELAAARVRTLGVEQLAKRLDNCFLLLTGGNRTALPRQQTLRATMDWSHDLLSEAERIIFRRLAVFAGDWTLEAAEAICAGALSDSATQRSALSIRCPGPADTADR